VDGSTFPLSLAWAAKASSISRWIVWRVASSGFFSSISLPDGRKTVIPALPLEMDGHRFGVRLDVPEFAEHTRPLLAELGYDAAEIDRLVADGVVAATR